MGGLMAARVLSDSYQRVTVVDRDVLPQLSEVRKGQRQPYRSDPRRPDYFACCVIAYLMRIDAAARAGAVALARCAAGAFVATRG
jgi:hypothetical protein